MPGVNFESLEEIKLKLAPFFKRLAYKQCKNIDDIKCFCNGLGRKQIVYKEKGKFIENYLHEDEKYQKITVYEGERIVKQINFKLKQVDDNSISGIDHSQLFSDKDRLLKNLNIHNLISMAIYVNRSFLAIFAINSLQSLQ